jgi:hypothetical protein
MQKKKITTKDQSRQFAIDWQAWQATQALSHQDLADWQAYFADLAARFDLADEFKENGIV